MEPYISMDHHILTRSHAITCAVQHCLITPSAKPAGVHGTPPRKDATRNWSGGRGSCVKWALAPLILYGHVTGFFEEIYRDLEKSRNFPVKNPVT